MDKRFFAMIQIVNKARHGEMYIANRRTIAVACFITVEVVNGLVAASRRHNPNRLRTLE